MEQCAETLSPNQNAICVLKYRSSIDQEDLGQVHGEVIAEHREVGSDPIVNDEDRYK